MLLCYNNSFINFEIKNNIWGLKLIETSFIPSLNRENRVKLRLLKVIDSLNSFTSFSELNTRRIDIKKKTSKTHRSNCSIKFKTKNKSSSQRTELKLGTIYDLSTSSHKK
ncbi:hypothetical protein BpHYR1_007968 [Brachionus plicatilis]|uniref:Uncharacterized protein n=1 Tax=Brachionus plicatilis TaxID=10195 RepID=A0A3M7R9W2_BRAPC|nr:hypothetical protein BpHYR1_007968 [Brachionus plicatilis]